MTMKTTSLLIQKSATMVKSFLALLFFLLSVYAEIINEIYVVADLEITSDD